MDFWYKDGFEILCGILIVLAIVMIIFFFLKDKWVSLILFVIILLISIIWLSHATELTTTYRADEYDIKQMVVDLIYNNEDITIEYFYDKDKPDYIAVYRRRTNDTIYYKYYKLSPYITRDDKQYDSRFDNFKIHNGD